MGRKKIFKNYFPRARVHHVVIMMLDKNGNVQMSEEQLKKCISEHDGAFSLFAYVLHSEDKYDAQAVFDNSEKNRKTYIERLRILSDAKGLERDETTESGFVYDAELEQRAHEYADEQFPEIEVNQKKPPHWHVIFSFSNARGADEIANWFKFINGSKLEPNWNEIKTGRGALESALAYLIHAHHPKKHQYSKDDVVASFDYVNQIEAQLALEIQHEKYHIDADIFNDVVDEVANGLSLNEAKKRVSLPVYFQRQQIFERARKDYVMNRAPMPLFREVFYVDSEGIDEDHGKGGLGKSACSKALAKQLAKEFGADVSKNVNDLQEYIFFAGDAKVFLQEYDGQPVVVIDEINGVDFKRACKGVNGVKALLSPYPERKSLDKKHGSVVCTAKYIIINGIQSFEAFKKDLAKSVRIDGEMQDSEESVKEQFDRRFWGLIHIIDASKIEFWVNRGLFDNTPEQQLLSMIGRVRASFQQIASRTEGFAQAQLEERALHPLLNEVNRSQDNHGSNCKISDPDELPEELLCIGELLDADEYEQEEIEEFFDVPASSNDAVHRIAWLVLADLAQSEMIDSMNDAVRAELLFAVERAIAWHFERKPFDDVKDREKRRLILKSLDILAKMGVKDE